MIRKDCVSFLCQITMGSVVFFSFPIEAKENCVPSREAVVFPHEGLYHRIHPSGNYFMYTDGDKSVMVDVTNRSRPQKIRTPMREEAYPVEGANGGWELVASPVKGGANGPNGGMDYFSFKDIVEKQTGVKPAYVDPDHGEYYHSTAELPGSTDKVKKVRTLLFQDRHYRDYEMSMSGEGKVSSAKKSEKGKLCDNVFKKEEKTPEQKSRFQQAQREIRKLEDHYYRARRSGGGAAGTAGEAEAVEIRKKMTQMQEAAESEYYGAEYAANRVESRAAREKVETARKTYEGSKEFLEARAAYNEAEKKYSDLDRAVRETPEAVRDRDELRKIEEEYRTAPQGQRREIEQRYHAVSRRMNAAYEQMRNTPERRAARLTYEQSERALMTLERSHPLGQAVTRARRDQEEIDVRAWELKDGRSFQNPVLSKDGTHVAGMVSGKIEVFSINDSGSCKSVARLPYRGSKVSFSYPADGKPLRVTFTTDGGPSTEFQNPVYVYDLKSGEAQIISNGSDGNTSYPGFTLDGRVMYKTDRGVAIVDPLQVSGKGCIAQGSVSSSRSSGSGKINR